MLKALADEHVPHAVVHALRAGGMDVATVQEQGRRGDDDPSLILAALEQQRILLTNDHDFLVLASRLAGAGQPFAPICFWPQQGKSAGEVAARIIQLASTAEYGDLCSQAFFL